MRAETYCRSLPEQRWCVACTFLLVISFSSVCSALEVEQVIWGFEGGVVPFRFNPVSILVSNPTPEAVDLPLHLQMTGVGPLGAKFQEPVFLAPYASRWVQFNVYVPGDIQDWTLSWGRGPKERKTIDGVRKTRPATIMLRPERSVLRGATVVKSFDDALFPTTVTATDGLETVLLDYVPRWQVPRRQALLDWIGRGGTLHLLYDSTGNYPEFTNELSVLNTPQEQFSHGMGRVFRHPVTRQDVDEQFLDQLPLSRANEGNSNRHWQADTGIFNQLRAITKPKHNWYVIHGLSLMYLVLVCPGWYLLGRRRFDYRLSMLSFVAVTCLFSLGFNYVGRRGYGESTAVNAVAVARPLADGHYDVTQWSNAFVTSGDTYLIKHAGSGQLYSTAQQFEAVNGVIDNGLDGVFAVEMPLFSSRTFLHRMKAAGAPLNMTASYTSAKKGIRNITIRVEGDLPEFSDARILYEDQLFWLSPSDQGLEISRPIRPQGLPDLVRQSDELAQIYMRPAWYQDDELDRSVEARYSSLFPLLITRTLEIQHQQHAAQYRLPADRARVFLYSTMPEAFHIQSDKLGRQAGRILYTFDLDIADAP